MNEQEYKWLCQVISAIGSSLELEQVLALAVKVAAQGAGCKASFLYLWDKKRKKLVLRAATEGYKDKINVIELSMGEGITGWTAKHLQPILIEEDAIKDERFLFVPGLDEEYNQSFLTVPIISSGRELIGVFTMYTLAPHKFPQKSLEFANKIATLVAGLIEKARLYEEMKKRLIVLDGLANLNKLLSKDDRYEVIVDEISKIIMEVINVDKCIIMFLNRDNTRFSLYQAPWTITFTEEIKTWMAEDKIISSEINELPECFNKLSCQSFKLWIAIPMQGKNNTLGIILGFRKSSHPFFGEDLNLLRTIAQQGALALERDRLISDLFERNRKQALFDVLFSSTNTAYMNEVKLAQVCDLDLSHPHAVVLMEPFPGTQKISAKSYNNVIYYVEDELEKLFPGCLYQSHSESIKAIIPVRTDFSELENGLTMIKKAILKKYKIMLYIGIGNICNDIKDYRQSLEEASEALIVGKLFLAQNKSVFSFNNLGIYRYLNKAWENNGLVRDKQQELMEKLLLCDLENDTNLLETLEKYLESLGNINQTADQLYIHRNTLRNRLDKINAILNIDIKDKDKWFSLYFALKIVKLRGKVSGNLAT